MPIDETQNKAAEGFQYIFAFLSVCKSSLDSDVGCFFQDFRVLALLKQFLFFLLGCKATLESEDLRHDEL